MPPKELAKQILMTDRNMLRALDEMYDCLKSMSRCDLDEDMEREIHFLLGEIQRSLMESQDAIKGTVDMLITWQMTHI